MTIEEQKQKCREILENGMKAATTLGESEIGGPQWFLADRFWDDLHGAFEELRQIAENQ